MKNDDKHIYGKHGEKTLATYVGIAVVPQKVKIFESKRQTSNKIACREIKKIEDDTVLYSMNYRQRSHSITITDFKARTHKSR